MIDTDIEVGMYGPLGWTAEKGINQCLAPFCNSRDASADFFTFEGIGAEQAQFLMNALPERNLSDRQNNGPILSEVLAACIAHPGLVTLEGYVIGTPRWDERVSVDGLTVHTTVVSQEVKRSFGKNTDVWKLVRNQLHLNTPEGPDDLAIVIMPDVPPSEHDGVKLGWWLWWD